MTKIRFLTCKAVKSSSVKLLVVKSPIHDSINSMLDTLTDLMKVLASVLLLILGC